MLLEAGQIVEGKVTGITNFGVFLDIGTEKAGLVHISEVSNSFVNDINEVLKVNDVVKAKVLNVGEDGKVSLSIKRAAPRDNEKKQYDRKPRHSADSAKPDGSYVWTPRKSEPASFEEMMNQFKQSSDEKFSDLKRKNPDVKRSKRGSAK